MKRLFFTLLFALSMFSYGAYAQSQCFEHADGLWELTGDSWDGTIGTINEGTACALEALGRGCAGLTSNEQTFEIFPDGYDISECALWCSDDYPDEQFSPALQATIFNKALGVADENTPTCPDTGEPMVVTDILFDWTLCPCGESHPFVFATITYACCVVGDDCNASFELEQSGDDCHIYATNTSTPSSVNDCGDCENPSGITSVSWSVYEYHDGPLGYVSYLTGSDDFHLDFDPSTATGPNDGYYICMTIEDCVGCSDRTCLLFDRFRPCRGLQNEGPEVVTKLQGKEKAFMAFPNPADQVLNLQVNSPQLSEGNNTLELFNLQGQLMYSQSQVSNGSTSIDVSAFVEGVYYLMLKDEQGAVQHSEKIIIQ